MIKKMINRLELSNFNAAAKTELNAAAEIMDMEKKYFNKFRFLTAMRQIW